MAPYNYKAKTLSGDIITGRFDVSDKNMVVLLLKKKGYYPIQIEENITAEKEVRIESLKTVSTRDLAILCRQFHTMIDAGVSVLSCLDMLKKQTENAQLAEVIGRVYDEVQKGRSLSESMKIYPKVFPVMMISLIEVGEVGGILDEILDRLSLHYEKENKMKQKIKTAMTYPAVIGCIALVMVIFMLSFVVPQFVSMFASFGSELPMPTRILMGISRGMTDIRFVGTAVIVVVLAVYFFNKFRRSSKGRHFLDSIVVSMPLIGKNVRKILASRFTRTLSALLNSGVPLIQSLEVVERVIDNQMVTKGMQKVREDVKRGSNLAVSLESVNIFPAMVVHMVNVGEEAGTLDSIMAKVADFYDDEVDTAIGQLISMLEPLLIFFLALVVGAIVVAMILPVFSMYGNIGA